MRKAESEGPWHEVAITRVKAYVINLPRSTSRRASMAGQLERMSLPYEFVEAVDGHALTPSERAGLVDEAAVARYPGWLTPGTIGCALSHRRAYERIFDSKEDVALVLEDDVVLPATISETVTELVPHMYGSEIVLLYYRNFGVCDFSASDAIELEAGAKLAYPLDVNQPLTASAYLITREACRKLIEAIVPVRVAADKWKHFYELGAIESLRCVIPRPVAVRKDFKSTIDYTGQESVRMRATGFITRNRIPPLVQLFTLHRYIIERRMSRTRTVADPSPIALARTGAAR